MIITKSFDSGVREPIIVKQQLPFWVKSVSLFEVVLKICKEGNIVILLVKDDPNKKRKKWSDKNSCYKFPGGMLNPEDLFLGEKFFQIANSKMKKETGGISSIAIEKVPFFSYFVDSSFPHLALFYLRKWVGGDPLPTGSVKESRFIKFNKVKKIQFENGLLKKHSLAFDIFCKLIEGVQKKDKNLNFRYRSLADYL